MTDEEIQETAIRLKSSDIKFDNEWMQEDVWDEIYAKEMDKNDRRRTY